MLGYAKIIGVAVIALLTVGLIWGINYQAYHRGYNDATLIGLQAKAKVEREYRIKNDALEIQANRAATDRQSMLDDLKRAASVQYNAAASHPARPAKPARQLDAARALWKNRFGQCQRDYLKLVSDTAQYADTINGLQKYVVNVSKQ